MLNKVQAAEFLGVTPRAIENYVAQGRLHVQYSAGLRGRIALFDEAELQRLKNERTQVPYLNPASGAVAQTTAQQPQQLPQAPLQGLFDLLKEPAVRDLLGELLKLAVQHWQESNKADQMALSVKEVSEQTGLSESTLRKDIRDGVLKAKLKGRGYKIRRTDLQRYLDEEWKD